MKTILFQGDSITDARRNRDCEDYSGSGYATMVKGALGAEYPGRFQFLNRGVGGNRIIDLHARVKADLLNLHPDYLSILIGLNDVWHEVARHNGVDTDKYELLYNMLIQEIQKALPSVQIMILEPFLLKGSAVDEIQGYSPEEAWSLMWTGVCEKAAAARRVAEGNHLPFIPLQSVFDDALQYAPASYWLIDGIHPTAMGHKLIADEWIRTFKRSFPM